MNSSFITYDDVYLVLKPISFDVGMVLFAIIVLIILVVSYKNYTTQISKFNYILISILIVANSVFLPLFLSRMYKEVKRFDNLSYQDTIRTILPGDLNGFYNRLDTTIKPDESFYFNDPADPFYDNVRTKFQLAYYLAPRKIAKSPSDADYLIIVNYLSRPNLKIGIPKYKFPRFYEYSTQLIFIKFIENNAKNSTDKGS